MIEKIDTSIRKLDEKKDGNMLQIYIYKHCKNRGNEGDKYLVVVGTQGGQPHQGVATDIEGLSIFNDNDYNLPKCKEYDTIAFVIVGGAEISEFMKSVGIE